MENIFFIKNPTTFFFVFFYKLMEQDLRYTAILTMLALIPFGFLKTLLEIFYVLTGNFNKLEVKTYPDGCILKTSLFALSYCSGSNNVVIPPYLLESESILISFFCNLFVFLCQCTSFFVRLFPFFFLFFIC
jgi:hypothetical protein